MKWEKGLLLVLEAGVDKAKASGCHSMNSTCSRSSVYNAINQPTRETLSVRDWPLYYSLLIFVEVLLG